MAELLQRFSGNPFSTPVGQKIEQATDPMLNSENWALNMEICDLINETDDGARDAVRAIKKRLQQSANKNFAVFMFTLTVLETCVKNCGRRFHMLVTNKDFVQEMVKLIGPKNDPPPEVQEKVLSLIQSWAEAFHGQTDLQGVSAVYNELRSKGVEFPKSTVEPKVPIHTPQRSISAPPPQRQTAMPASAVTAPPPSTGASEIYPIHLSPEQLNKLKNELEVVQGNMKVLSEMLTEMKPGEEHRDDWELLLELYGTCQSMQKRIVELIEKVANEEVTNELLRINDELNNLFMRFERYQKKRASVAGSSAAHLQDITMIASTSTSNVPPVAGTSSSMNLRGTAVPAGAPIPSLIDFTDDEPDALVGEVKSLQIASQPATQTAAHGGDHEFDMFAQLRSNPGSSTAVPSTSAASDLLSLDPVATVAPTQKNGPNEDVKEVNEIEQWLGEREQSNTPSMQFEQFLARRADALDQQPAKKSTSYNNHDSSLI
ncbi:PREDICTED: TOM1-like protein 2 [Rhagoletis zephyria]|uniref:TOM1-like protein 2 n=1 Tax=Rhagoletis zephyria TaxID=28612 RepID=UPI0008118942|nr:PREDICTED: TOM1-like protein 2 [Rhagoletis zephyria]